MSYARLVGAELVRLRAGRPRVDVARAIGVQSETLGRYEDGRGDLAVVTFAELCRELGAAPGTVLARVDASDDVIVVDARMVVASGNPDLSVLRRWAVLRLTTPDTDPVTAVPVDGVVTLALTHGVDPGPVLSALGSCVPGVLLAP